MPRAPLLTGREDDTCSQLSLRFLSIRNTTLTYYSETYSTDFDTADKLYFEELSYERVMDIYELENSSGCVVSVGGQLPQNIALRLQETGGAKILGTNPKDIDKAEDRQKFSEILDNIGVDQPAWKELTSVADAEAFADEVNFPVNIPFLKLAREFLPRQCSASPGTFEQSLTPPLP